MMTQSLSYAQQLALWAERLRDISAMGLRYSNVYDHERYTQIQDIVIEMLALSGGEAPQALEPLRAALLSRPTPLAVGDGAIIDEAGRILLIRREDNHLWAMPGGALQVGESPAEGVLREVMEETGWRCTIRSLMGVYDSRLCGTVTRNHLYHFQFLCRPRAQEKDPPSHAHESLGQAWYAEAELPPDLDPGHGDRIRAAFRFREGQSGVYFDPPGPA